MACLQYVVPHGPAWWIVLQVLARIVAILLGLAMLFPSVMVSDSGAEEAVNAMNILLLACFLMILAGILGGIGLAVVSVASIVVAFSTGNVVMQKIYLYALLPLGAIGAIGFQFHIMNCWRKTEQDQSTKDGLLSSDVDT